MAALINRGKYINLLRMEASSFVLELLMVFWVRRHPRDKYPERRNAVNAPLL